jgi:RIO-like serine/threonine protein kinase
VTTPVVAAYPEKPIKIRLSSEGRPLYMQPLKVKEIVKDDKLYMVMERIQGKTFYEMYGSNPNNVPPSVWKKAYNIISRLYYNDIHYVDVSPHNFMINEKGDVFVIDFGDAYECKVNWFLKDFLDGEKTWNPDFE